MTALARKSLLALSGDGANAVLGLAATYFVARRFGAEILGVLGYFMGLLGILAFLGDVGLHRAFLKRAAEDPRESGAYVSTFLAVKILLTVALLTVSALAPMLDPRLGLAVASPEAWSAYWFIVLFYVSNSLMAVPIFLFRARRETARMMLVAVGGHAVSSVAKIAVAVWDLGLPVLAAAYALQTVAGVALGAVLMRHVTWARPRGRHARRLIEYATPVAVVTGLLYLAQNVDRVLLERWAGAQDVGYYTAVTGLVVLLQRPPLAAITLFFPQAAEDAGRGDWNELLRRLRVVERWALMVTVPLAAAVVGLSDLIVETYLGAAFAPSAGVLAVMALSPVLFALFEPYNTIVYAVERHARLAGVTLLGLVTMVAVDAILIPREFGGYPMAGLGAVGAAVGIVVAQAVTGACQLVIATRAMQISPSWRGGRQLVAGGIMLGTIVLVRAVVPGGLVSAAAAIAAGIVLFAGTLLVLRELGPDDLGRAADLLSPGKMAAYIKSELRH
jgi:O-antigen/teichoic acid export membrane protein